MYQTKIIPAMLSAIVLLTLLLIQFTYSSEIKGSIQLDVWTFDKVISKFNASLVKFDKPYSYGKIREEFTKLASAARTSSELLIVEVGIKDYGKKDNKELGDKYGVDPEKFPVVKLFLQGEDEPIDFEMEFTYDNIKDFIQKYTDTYIGLDNCLEVFDKLTEQFMIVRGDNEKEEILQRVEEEKNKLKDPKDIDSAENYIKIMKKVLRRGDEFIEKERSRVEKLLKEKVTPAKKEELEGKLNILQSFKHDEF